MPVTESVYTTLVSSHVEGNKVYFTVNMSNLSGKLLYVFPGSYDKETGKCECYYQPQIAGVPEA